MAWQILTAWARQQADSAPISRLMPCRRQMLDGLVLVAGKGRVGRK